MKTLYIIGNGFDLAHGIKSSYKDFEAYVLAIDPFLHEELTEMLFGQHLWSDFEKALGELDTDTITEYALDFLESYGSEDWSDAYHHDYQWAIQQKIELVTVRLLSIFKNWILQLDIPSATSSRVVAFRQDALFLSFNYTPTLESIYAVPASQITYIHNKATGPDSHLLLGHAVPPTPPPSACEDDDPRMVEGERIIARYFRDTFKPTTEVIKNHEHFFAQLLDVNEIFVLGHSIQDVDWPYYSEILARINLSSVIWNVSYHTHGDLVRHKSNLLRLGVAPGNLNLRPLSAMSF